MRLASQRKNRIIDTASFINWSRPWLSLYKAGEVQLKITLKIYPAICLIAKFTFMFTSFSFKNFQLKFLNLINRKTYTKYTKSQCAYSCQSFTNAFVIFFFFLSSAAIVIT